MPREFVSARFTTLDEIENLHAEVLSGHVILRSFRELPFHTAGLRLDTFPSTQPVERQAQKEYAEAVAYSISQ